MNRELHVVVGSSGAPLVVAPGLEPDWSTPVCLLLHGYNVDPPGAQRAFSSLFSTIEHAVAVPTLLISQSWLLCWPGYVSLGLASGKAQMSALTYPNQITSARRAAEAMREYIDQRSGKNPQISIIAHSLGSRVALELLDSYARYPGSVTPYFPVLILMAAALPTYFFEDLAALWQGALLPEKKLILFSERDRVLIGAFRIGQTVAGEGYFPRAVGATGHPPVGFWTDVFETTNNHSGYFADQKTANEIARSLGSAPPKLLPASPLTGGAIVTAASLPSKQLDTRHIRGDKGR
jgi:hypothetical protein